MVKHILSSFFFTLGLIVIAWPTPSYANQVSAYVDKNHVQYGEFLQLTIEHTGSDKLNAPDFSPLHQDFELIGNTSNFSQTSYVNGRVTKTNTWSITIVAKRPGAAVVPPITVGKYKTQAITVVVSNNGNAQSSNNKESFLDVSVNRRESYVQEQLLVNINLFLKRQNISNVQLDDLTIDNAVVKALGDPTQRETTRNGVRYVLVNKKYAVYPEKSGTLTIPALRFSAIVREGRSFGQFGRQRRISSQSQATDVEIKPIPNNYPQSASWLPAQTLTLQEQWSPNASIFTVGKPITRVITITTQGLTAASVPPLSITDGDTLPPQIKVYPETASQNDQINTHGITGETTQTFTIIPTQEGTVNFPEIQLVWWDTRSRRERTATLPARTITIDPSIIPLSSDHTPPQTSPQTQGVGLPSALTTAGNNQTLIVICGLLSVAWMITCAVLWNTHRRLRQLIAQQHNALASQTQSSQQQDAAPFLTKKQAFEHLKKACSQKDPQQLHDALISWSRTYFQDASICSLAALRNTAVNNTDVDSSAFKQQLSILEQLLYAGDRLTEPSPNLDYALILEQIRAYQKQPRNDGTDKKNHVLPELYPNATKS